MWSLQSIEATNLCAFEHFKYNITQDQATLIFGNNIDNPSQNSNGSGKSALIEAIAIALTGETLRKVNMDEIINDRYDECVVEAFLANKEKSVGMRITRTIPRKGTQEIKIIRCEVWGDEEVKQASILDYNRYILDTIGLTKDDIYSNFILTAKKYKSFLSSSDREKKEIINRFSNGVLVDESIEALHQDMGPVQEELSEAESTVAENNGKVIAIHDEIEKAIAESNGRSASRKERIENWKNSIADKRAYIREQKSKIQDVDADDKALGELDKRMQKLENSKKSFTDTVNTIKQEFEENTLTLDTDYNVKVEELQDQVSKQEEKVKDYLTAEKEAKKAHEKAIKALDKAKVEHDRQSSEADDKEAAIKEKLANLTKEVKTFQSKEDELRKQRKEIGGNITFLSTLLAGTITCPKCKHEFTLNEDFDVAEGRKKQTENEKKLEEIDKQIEATQTLYDECVANGKAARKEESEVANLKASIESALKDAESAVNTAKQKYDDATEEVGYANNALTRIQKQLDNLRQDMFDNVFAVIDNALSQNKADVKQYQLNISNAEGAIASYEESIKEAEKAAETDIVASLKESKTKYEEALQQSIRDKEIVERKYNEFKIQEANFVEFKTYLANIKIDAISEITNDFLETIGSDIRLKLSGYTLLKSGKVRDKISVSVIRDGVDCGSFEKLSNGEQTRVALANILALHKLTNVNCEEGKGLNLLVFDEILDATDEQGLSNVFQALNDTQITSLVVSHGNIAENYPNRLIINKQNGISFID